MPIDPAAAGEFDVNAVPTTAQLVAELNAAPADRPSKVSRFPLLSSSCSEATEDHGFLLPSETISVEDFNHVMCALDTVCKACSPA